MTTDTLTRDLAGLFAACYTDAADDTVRLALADCLEEQGEADRAEFVRVQVELEQLRPGGRLVDGSDATLYRVRELASRDFALLDAHPEWLRMPCPACRGRGQIVWAVPDESPPTYRIADLPPMPTLFRTEEASCPTCNGERDLFRMTVSGGGSLTKSRNPRYSRGLLTVECRVGELSVCPECRGRGARAFHGWDSPGCGHCGNHDAPHDSRTGNVPSDWARSVVANPFVVGLVDPSRKPWRHSKIGFGWSVLGDSRPHHIPKWLFTVMVGEIKTDAGPDFQGFRFYPTEAAAVDALSGAAAGWARGASRAQ